MCRFRRVICSLEADDCIPLGCLARLYTLALHVEALVGPAKPAFTSYSRRHPTTGASDQASSRSPLKTTKKANSCGCCCTRVMPVAQSANHHTPTLPRMVPVLIVSQDCCWRICLNRYACKGQPLHCLYGQWREDGMRPANIIMHTLIKRDCKPAVAVAMDGLKVAELTQPLCQ